jgi:uncharacterized membrane protein YkvA (DUF1232 family)
VSAALWLTLLALLLAGGRRERARGLLTLIPDCVVLVQRLLADPRVPRRTKIVLGLVVGYLASPIDLIPDFVPGLGLLDDALVVAAAIAYVRRTVGQELVAELWPGGGQSRNAALAGS